MALRIIARSVHGLEWVCADEIVAAVPGVDDLRLTRREIAFRVPTADRALLDLRTVDDVFLHVGEITGVGTTKADIGTLTDSVVVIRHEVSPAGSTELAPAEVLYGAASARPVPPVRGSVRQYFMVFAGPVNGNVSL